MGFFPGEDFPFVRHQLPGQGVGDWLGQFPAADAQADGQFFVVFVPAHPGEVIPARIKEEGIQMGLGALHRWRFAGAKLAVDLQKGFLGVLGAVLVQGGAEHGVLAEEVDNLVVGAKAQGADKGGHRQFAVLIDAHIEHIVGIGLIFQPRAAVGVQRGGEQFLARLVVALAEIHARGTDELRDDNTLGAVDDEGAGIRHERKIAHEDLLLLHFAGLLVQQTRFHAKRGRIGDVALLALLDGVLGLGIQPVVDKVEHQVAGVVFDRRNVPEDLFQALFEKPLV